MVLRAHETIHGSVGKIQPHFAINFSGWYPFHNWRHDSLTPVLAISKQTMPCERPFPATCNKVTDMCRFISAGAFVVSSMPELVTDIDEYLGAILGPIRPNEQYASPRSQFNLRCMTTRPDVRRTTRD